MKEVMQQMLQDVIDVFGSNPEETRSIKSEYLCKDGETQCTYHPPKSKPKSIGCAIGMYIPWEDAKKLDVKYRGTGSGVVSVINDPLIPKWLKEVDVKFLSELQGLHDNNSMWLSNGLSEGGIKHVKRICTQYDLSYEKLKFNQ